MNITNELANSWRESGIFEGDTVLIHSSIKRTYKNYLKRNIKLSPKIIFDSFLEAVGTEGTLVFPLFNFDFCSNQPFDIHSTVSHMGALTEVARKQPESVRTGHPVYSFCVIGKNKEPFKEVCNYSAYGSDSPFAILHKENAKIAVLGLPENSSMTFYHYVEEMLVVDYRYHKKFTSLYTGRDGLQADREFSIYVRDLERGIQTDVDPAGELMWEKGLYSGSRYNEGNGLRVISSSKLYNETKNIINQDKALGLLYKVS